MQLKKISITTIIITITILVVGNVDLKFNGRCRRQYVKPSDLICEYSWLKLTKVLALSPTPVAAESWLNEQEPSSQAKLVEQSEPQLLTIYEPIQNFEWEGMFTSPQGITYFAEEVAPDWLTTNELAVEFARRNRDRKAEAKALFDLGLANHAVGGYFDRAIDYYKQSLVIAKEISDRDLEVLLLGNLGLAYLQKGYYYIEPFTYLQEYFSYTWHKAYYYNGGDPKLGGMALGNLGNAYYGADLYAKAIETHQQRLELAQELKDRRGEGKALGDLGIVYHALGEYDQAIEYQQQRLAISRAIKEPLGEGQALSNLGIIYHSLGKYNQAIEYQQQYLAISRTIKNPRGEIQALGNLAGAYYFLGDYNQAIELYEQALAVAYDIRESQMANKVRGNLGLVYFQKGDFNQALELYQRFFASASLSNSRQEEAVVLNNTAVIQFTSGNLSAASSNLRKGIERLESLRTRLGNNDAYKVSIFETQNTPYINLQKILIAQNQAEAALEIAERGRARAFVELLSQGFSSGATEESAITPPNIEQIKQIAKDHHATIVEYSIISENFKEQNRLQTKESTLLIWVVKPSGEVALRQVKFSSLGQKQPTSLEKLVLRSRNSIGVRGIVVTERPGNQLPQEANSTENLQQLHNLLIEPIAELLPQNPNNHVIFIPQGELFLVPFSALQDNSGKYLIEKHTILTAPSIQVLDLTHKQRNRIGDGISHSLVVGNPSMPSVSLSPGEKPQQLSSLPGAEREANAIAPLLNTQPLIGNQATETAIKQQLGKARMIHLATHGLLDEIRGLGSAIALTPSNKDDGLLTAEEILDLQLNAELVVLSACDTGRGRITGDGVVGLSRSFISAGVPSVIVSLWQVPDAPTASLMTQFYQSLSSNPDKAQALRGAMLATMKQYPDPKDWAAFTLIGEANLDLEN
ncbi:MAG: CHAT domain-containing protein [Symploca sp. SIO2C1]|nr:CHAT domain-containing protein [Symploca sp. SIO2C1]